MQQSQPIPQKQNALARYGLALIVLAQLGLPLILLLRRSGLVAASERVFFSTAFSLMLGAALLMALVSLMAAYRGWLQALLGRVPRWSLPVMWGFSVALMLAVGRVAGLGDYAAMLALWLMTLNAGVASAVLGRSGMLQLPADFLRNAALMLAGILAPLLLIEVGMRVYFGTFGSPEQKVAYIYSADEALAFSNNGYMPRPYVNYMPSPTDSEHNAQGFRYSRDLGEKAPQTFRIFALGGSTTYGTGLRLGEDYPAQLQRILHQDYGYTHVEVINAGAEAYSSFDSLANLSYRVLDYQPDMIIIYHGINDVRARLVDPAQYNGLNAERGLWDNSVLQNQLPASTLLRFIGVQLGTVPNLNSFEAFINAWSDTGRCALLETFCAQIGMEASDILAANPPIYFQRNLRNMAAIARANGVAVVFSRWDYTPNDDLALQNFLVTQHVQAGIAEQNTLLVELATALDVPLIPFDMTDDAALWQDGMHMTAAGTAEQAAQYAAFLIENDLIPPPTS